MLLISVWLLRELWKVWPTHLSKHCLDFTLNNFPFNFELINYKDMLLDYWAIIGNKKWHIVILIKYKRSRWSKICESAFCVLSQCISVLSFKYLRCAVRKILHVTYTLTEINETRYNCDRIQTKTLIKNTWKFILRFIIMY